MIEETSDYDTSIAGHQKGGRTRSTSVTGEESSSRVNRIGRRDPGKLNCERARVIHWAGQFLGKFGPSFPVAPAGLPVTTGRGFGSNRASHFCSQESKVASTGLGVCWEWAGANLLWLARPVLPLSSVSTHLALPWSSHHTRFSTGRSPVASLANPSTLFSIPLLPFNVSLPPIEPNGKSGNT